MIIKKPYDLKTYEEFAEQMRDPEFSVRMHYAMKTLLEIVEKDPSFMTGDDERLATYWAKFQGFCG